MMSPHLLEQARQIAVQHAEPLVQALQSVAGMTPEAALRELAETARIPVLPPEVMRLLTADFSALSYSECLLRLCLAGKHEGAWVVVLANPLDDATLTWAAYRVPGDFTVFCLHPLELKAWLARLEGHHQAVLPLLHPGQEIAQGRESEEISLTSIAQHESQVVKLVNATLYDAHRNQASDIHLENTPDGLVIKYRIDGVLGKIRELPDAALAEQVVSRLKVMAELDIGERRVPQDGRFTVNIQKREIDFRVSIMPGLFGEDAVLRILDKQHLVLEMQGLSLETLGFDARNRQIIRRLAALPYGMLLVTGPTGSGKTTTLYAALTEVNHGDDKVITIEDPVEYQLAGVLQIPVNEKKGLTFARGLRSILRHDPDRILVGEIRDRETAEIAVQAALTGHLVYTSVHANNVFDVISRFRHMGVDAYSFVTALNGIVAQRLVRVVCENCSEAYTPESVLLSESGLGGVDISTFHFRRGQGCAHCRGTGFKGRKALAEVLVMTDTLRELVLQQASVSQLKAVAKAGGMKFMWEMALEAVAQGMTTLEEVSRVARPEA